MTQTLTLLQILAMTMYGEAAILQDADAAMAVGHVFMNRLEEYHLGRIGFGSTPEEVAKGFNGFAATSLDDVPSSFLRYAEAVVNRDSDPTGGCLYILSRSDMYLTTISDGDMKRAIQLMVFSDWRSVSRIINGRTYRLYGFRKFPTDIEYYIAKYYVSFLMVMSR